MPDPHTIVTPPPPERPLLDQPGEEKLRQELEQLRRQLEQERRRNGIEDDGPNRPSRRKLWILGLILALVLLTAFLLGLVPHLRRERLLRQEARNEAGALPVISYIDAQRSPASTQLVLPGNIEAITEAPVLARADGFLKTRVADIGDRVQAGQLLAEIAAPDLDQQVSQARAQLLQARASLRQATAAVDQARANQALSKVTADRWAALLTRGAVAPQDNDTQQANYRAQTANLAAMMEAESAALQNASAAQANLDHYIELQGYEQVRAPFAGVITLRNVDTGALIANEQTLLYRIAQTARLRTYIYVPETDAPLVQVGQRAQLAVAAYPGRQFTGEIARTSSALDPSTRTLVTEVQVANPSGILHPGMYSEVSLNESRPSPPILIPADALVVRADGTFAAVLQGTGPEVEATGRDQSQTQQSGKGKNGSKGKTNSKGKSSTEAKSKKNDQQEREQLQEQQQELPTFTVHLAPVSVGRDYGNAVEILTGLKPGDHIIESPNDFVQEGAQVKGQKAKENPIDSTGAGGAKTSGNSEQLNPVPGAEPLPQPSSPGAPSAVEPSKENPNRGPGR